MKTKENYLENIYRLIELGKGNEDRLRHIIRVIKEGRRLYNSDQNYLENLINKYLNQ